MLRKVFFALSFLISQSAFSGIFFSYEHPLSLATLATIKKVLISDKENEGAAAYPIFSNDDRQPFTIICQPQKESRKCEIYISQADKKFRDGTLVAGITKIVELSQIDKMIDKIQTEIDKNDPNVVTDHLNFGNILNSKESKG